MLINIKHRRIILCWVLLFLGACGYRFPGGGNLPSGVEKVFIEIFENRDLNAYYRVNDDIHLIVARTSGNTVLARHVEELLNRTKIYLILYDPFFTMPINPSIHEHRQLVAALEKGDPAAAEAAMEIHLNSAFQGMDIQTLPDDYIAL